METSIILARPQANDKRDLELLLNLHFKERFSVKEASRVHFHQYMELLIINSNTLDPEELVALRNNHVHPVIMLSDQTQESLIEQYNIFRSIERINPSIIPIIQEAIQARSLIIQSVGDRPEIFFNLDVAIEKALKEAREKERVISSFEALYDILQKSPAEALDIARKDPRDILLEQLNTRVVPFLEEYERNNYTHYLHEAQESFRQVLHVLKEVEAVYHTTGDSYKEIEFLVGGSTLSEQGRRCLIGINAFKKYDITKGPHGYFLRDVHDRKGISHAQIAKIRYDTQKHLAEVFSKKGNAAAEIGKFTKIYHPLSYDAFTYLIQEALIGPDLEYVLLKIRDAIPAASDTRQAALLKNLRDAIIEKYLNDLVGWQKHTQKIIDEDAKRMGRKPEVIARYFKKNLEQIPEEYKSAQLVNITDNELELWNNCLKYLNPQMLGISRSSVVLSQDASSKNAILHIGRKFPSIEELIDAMTDSKNGKKEFSREKLDNIFYHVDTGFVITHFLEDFFHIIDAYEAADTGLSKRQILNNRQKLYAQFCKKKGIAQAPIVLNLAGAYRNMRRAFLVVKEFHNKNVTFARENLTSEYAYNNFRRSYEQMNEHHMQRAVIYLDELNNQFKELAAKTNVDISDIKASYRAITSLQELTAESAVHANEFITDLQQKIQDETNRKKKKYLSAALHGTMSYCMARLAERMIKVKLPNYESATRGVLDE